MASQGQESFGLAVKTSWTLETLKELIEQRLDSMDKALTAALQATKEAIQKAETATEKRFESVNEFRSQLGDQARTFMPRLEAEQRLDQLVQEQLRIKAKMERQEGKEGGISGLAAGIATGISVLVAVGSLAYALTRNAN